MNKHGKILSLVLLLILVSVTATAYTNFDVDVEGVDTEIYPERNGTAQFHINVTNNFGERKSFNIGYNTGTATDSSWFYLNRNFITLEPGQSEVSTLNVQMKDDETVVAGNRGPELYVYPADDPSNKFSSFATFRVRRDEKVMITNFESPKSSYKPTEGLKTGITIRNVVQEDYSSNYFEVRFTVNGETFTEGVPSIDSGDTETVSKSIDISGFEAGDYELAVELVEFETREVVEIKTSNFRVEEYRNVTRNETVVERPFWSKHNLSVKNVGNSVIEKEEITTSVEWYEQPFLSYEREPDTVREEEGERVLVWEVEDLERMGTANVIYSRNYWSALVVLLIVVVVFFIIYKQLHSVSVVKFVNSKGSNISVNVRVRNNTGRNIDKTMVEDFVPGIATLINKFDSKSPDRVQKTDEGTRLVWEIGRMEPGEERILVYNLKPRIRVEGSINLPEASIRYKVKDKKFRENSHSVSTDFN